MSASGPVSSTSRFGSNLSLTLRPSLSRGHSLHGGWLNSYHSFSFSSYSDRRYPKFHSLRVLNEDRVKGGEGFGSHSHRDFEIFSYVVSGQLEHQDSMGNNEMLERGAVQFTSAGKGITHSEFNAHRTNPVHFLQVWVKPHTIGLTPKYKTKLWPDSDKLNQLRLILSPDGKSNSITINQDVNVYATLLDVGHSVEVEVKQGRGVYVHLIQDASGWDEETRETSLTVSGSGSVSDSTDNSILMEDGDGVYVELEEPEKDGKLIITANPLKRGGGSSNKKAEFLVLDLKKETDDE